jgi:hypothetical protein
MSPRGDVQSRVFGNVTFRACRRSVAEGDVAR